MNQADRPGAAIKIVGVIGAGTMGHGFAQVLAQHGRHVRLTDRSRELAERGKELIATNFQTVIDEGFSTRPEVDAALQIITVTGDLGEAVAGADLVLEAAPEKLELKQAIFRELSRLTRPDTILASNTSSFDINELATVVEVNPGRVIGTHWYNPPQIVPCVEVIPARATTAATVQTMLAFLEEMGKAPAITKSVPGFVGNRIQLVMAAEAFRCLEEGVATAEDIDRIIRTSFGFRLGAFGIFEIADLAGLDTYLNVFDYLAEQYKRDWYRAPDSLRERVDAGRLGVKSGAGVYEYDEEQARQVRAQRDHKLYQRLRAYLADRAASSDPASSKRPEPD